MWSECRGNVDESFWSRLESLPALQAIFLEQPTMISLLRSCLTCALLHGEVQDEKASLLWATFIRCSEHVISGC